MDVSLPNDVPIAEFMPQLAELLGVDSEFAPLWVLSSSADGALPVTSSLTEAKIDDGSRLFFSEQEEAPDGPFVDDAIRAIGCEADARGDRWRGGARETGSAALVASLAAALAVTVAVIFPGVEAGVGGVLMGGLAAGLSVWMPGDRTRQLFAPAVVVCLACAGYAFGSLSADGGMEWLALFTAGAVGVALTGALRGLPKAVGWIGAIDAVVLGAVTAAKVAGLSVLGIAAWGLIPLLFLLAATPSWALSSSGLVAAVRRADEGALVRRVDVATGVTAATLATDVMIGVGTTLGALALAVVGWSSVWVQAVLAPVAGLVLLSFSRSFSCARHVLMLRAAGLAGLATMCLRLPVWVGLSLDSDARHVSAALAVVFAVVLVGLAGLTLGHRLNDVSRARVVRTLDAIQSPLAVAVLPVLFLAQGVYLYFWP